LRLDLVRSITDAIAEAETIGVEIGGILVGSLPTEATPVLRVEGFTIVPRPAEDGPVYLLDPLEQERFAAIRASASQNETASVGFFRSHIRPGPLRPSLADRSLLAGQFGEAAYAVLLIQARPPRTAAFFVAESGQLPTEPSVPEFRFEESEFSALPEVDLSTVTEADAEAERLRTTRLRAPGRAKRAIAASLIVVAFAALLFWILTTTQWFRAGANQMELAVAVTGRLLTITWNHSASDIKRASGGKLTIVDGSVQRSIDLGEDELKLGKVEYDGAGTRVDVTLTVDMPGSVSVSQSAHWQSR